MVSGFQAACSCGFGTRFGPFQVLFGLLLLSPYWYWNVSQAHVVTISDLSLLLFLYLKNSQQKVFLFLVVGRGDDLTESFEPISDHPFGGDIAPGVSWLFPLYFWQETSVFGFVSYWRAPTVNDIKS